MDKIILIIVGILCVFIPKTHNYEEATKKQNYFQSENFMVIIRRIVGGIFILLGSLSLFQ